MKKIIILIPVFNDWDSLIKLLYEINENIKNFKNIIFECVVVNDASTTNQPELIKPNNIKSFQILNMKENRGHARCNAFGIRYIYKNKEFDNLILMDGDGEDRPVEIKDLINEIFHEPNKSIVAKRLIKKGSIIKYKDLSFKSPGGGLEPYNYKKIVNKIAQKDFLEDDLILIKNIR